MSSPKQITMDNALVESFNRLPRKPKVPSGKVPNTWHFDMRYVPLEPNPSHIVVIINPDSLYLHMERLPLGLEDDKNRISFFPESSKAAAPEIAKALMHAFVTNTGLDKMMGANAPPAFGPWNFTTEDKELAVAVGAELKRLGVSAAELCKIGVTKPTVIKTVDAQFDTFYKALARSAGYDRFAPAVMVSPNPIVFSNFQFEPIRRDDSEIQHQLDYISTLNNSRPVPRGVINASNITTEASLAAVERLKIHVKDKPEAVIRQQADEGNADAALDYGLRLILGLGCKVDRTTAHEYLCKAAVAPDASDLVKISAQAILVKWCTDTTSKSIRSRYMFAALHHAEQAALLSLRVNPKRSCAPSLVLKFMQTSERLGFTMPQLQLSYKNAVAAYTERQKEIQRDVAKLQHKRLEKPLRYRCAALGCGIQADAGRALLKCAGQCDMDKKPSYCSKECQKADWKNHKPFCAAGAECSVIDETEYFDSTPGHGTGSIQVPITNPDGTQTLLSSSTMSPQMMREIRDLTAKWAAGEPAPGSSRSRISGPDVFSVDVHSVD